MKWKQRFQKASQDGKFDKKSISLSKCWDTCAVGEIFGLSEKHFKTNLGYEASETVYELGLEFADAVSTHDTKEARRLYNLIKQYHP